MCSVPNARRMFVESVRESETRGRPDSDAGSLMRDKVLAASDTCKPILGGLGVCGRGYIVQWAFVWVSVRTH